MSTRASRANRLPGNDELFRATGTNGAAAEPAGVAPIRAVQPPEPTPPGERRASGRERHDEKITVYVSSDELVDLEHARLVLRRDHGLKVDRGRIVRAALADALGDLETAGTDSRLLDRLRAD